MSWAVAPWIRDLCICLVMLASETVLLIWISINRVSTTSPVFSLSGIFDYCLLFHLLTSPPSTSNVWPKTNDTLSDNNQTTAFSISSGSAIRPIGYIDVKWSRNWWSSSSNRLTISVSTPPGATIFIPWTNVEMRIVKILLHPLPTSTFTHTTITITSDFFQV